MSYSLFEQDPREAFPNIEDYFAIKAACTDDYRHALHRHLPTDDELKECAKYFADWPSVRVMHQWRSGEPKSRPQAALEVALRYVPSSHPLACHVLFSCACDPASATFTPPILLNHTHSTTAQALERVRRTQSEPRSRALRPRRVPRPHALYRQSQSQWFPSTPTSNSSRHLYTPTIPA